MSEFDISVIPDFYIFERPTSNLVIQRLNMQSESEERISAVKQAKINKYIGYYSNLDVDVRSVLEDLI